MAFWDQATLVALGRHLRIFGLDISLGAIGWGTPLRIIILNEHHILMVVQIGTDIGLVHIVSFTII